MRIVLIGPVPPFRGGIAHYTSQLSLALADAGHDLLLISFKRQYPRWLFPGNSDRDPSQQPIESIQAQFWLDSLNPLSWLATFRRIRRLKPDLIILPWWTVFWAPAWMTLGVLNRYSGTSEWVILCHNVLPHDAKPWQRTVTRQVFRWADRFVVQSADELVRLRDLLPKASAQVAPHPVYQMIPRPELDKTAAKMRLEIDPARPVLLFFGIVRPYKGLDILLAAMPEICAQIPHVLLVVAGEFWQDPAAYAAQIRGLGMDHAVRMDNRYIPNEEVALLFAAADLAVAPYRTMTGSGVVQLARGFGVPVVATVEAARGPGVVVVPNGDVDALAVAIVAALTHPPAPPSPIEDAGWTRLVAALVDDVDAPNQAA